MLIVVLSLQSCNREYFCVDGKGDLKTRILDINDFTGIDLQEGADVFIVQGPNQLVEVTGHDNVLDNLEEKVNGSIWDINLGKDCFNDLDLSIFITVPYIEELHLSGSGNIIVADFEDQYNLDMTVLGSGKIQVNRFSGTQDVDVRISGSGKIIVSDAFPDLDNLDVQLNGSGKLKAFPMVSQKADIEISGSGDLFITASEYLDVKISGSGDLHYKGNPIIKTNITGSGVIINEN